MRFAYPQQVHIVSDFRDWSPAVARTLVPFSMQCPDASRFRGSIRQSSYAGLHLVDMSASAHVAMRTRSMSVSGTASAFVLALQLVGSVEVRQGRRNAVLEPGDFTLYDTSQSFFAEVTPSFRCLNVRLSATDLGLPIVDLRALTAALIDGQRGLAPAVAALLTNLRDTLADSVVAAPRATADAASLTRQLVRSMLAGVIEERNEPALTQSRGVIEHILITIEENLARPSLSVQDVAKSTHMSTRQVHRHFESMGTTFACVVRSKRIEQCKVDLLDPRWASGSIAAIGDRWGFENPSHFSQVFKTYVGVTPTEYRNQLQGLRS